MIYFRSEAELFRNGLNVTTTEHGHGIQCQLPFFGWILRFGYYSGRQFNWRCCWYNEKREEEKMRKVLGDDYEFLYRQER